MKVILQRVLQEIMKKKLYLDHQTMGQQDDHPIDSATKCIILKTEMSNFELVLPFMGIDDVGISTSNIHPLPFYSP